MNDKRSNYNKCMLPSMNLMLHIKEKKCIDIYIEFKHIKTISLNNEIIAMIALLKLTTFSRGIMDDELLSIEIKYFITIMLF